MVEITKRLLILFLLFGVAGTVHAKAKVATHPKVDTSFVHRKWVVKLKQNSLMNRRPFQFATPVVEGDTLYVGVERGLFYAVSISRGKKIWTYQAQGGIEAQATIHDQTVFVPDTKGNVYALDKIKGKVLWVANLDGEIMSAPLYYDNKLYVVTLSKELAILDADKGTVLWQIRQRTKDLGFTVRKSANPVYAGGNILVGYSDGTLVAHDPKDGRVKWGKQLGDRSKEFHDIDATILVAGQVAYVTSADNHLFALNPNNGETLWIAPMGNVNNALLYKDALYVTANGIVYSLKPDSGEIVWEQNLNVAEISSPAAYGEWLTVVATKGKTYFLDRNKGDILHSWFVKGGSYSDPILLENRVFLLSNASRLYSFEFNLTPP